MQLPTVKKFPFTFHIKALEQSIREPTWHSHEIVIVMQKSCTNDGKERSLTQIEELLYINDCVHLVQLVFMYINTTNFKIHWTRNQT